MKKIIFPLLVLVLSVPFYNLGAQSVDILWQGETYVSPFYKGKALWSSQSRITLVALPHGLGDSSNLNYKWTKNGTVLGNINGKGKNTLSFVDSILSIPQTIEVEITTSDNDIVVPREIVLTKASVFVEPIAPILSVYENNPLYGFMFNKETSGTYELKNKEVTFTAFPLFFSALNRTDPRLSYEWHTNSGDVETKNSVTYRSPDNVEGTSEVRANVSNTDQITQFANSNFLVKFAK